jgi:hypothetical protein
MADYSAIRAYFDSNQLHYYTFHPKYEKPIKAVIRQLPGGTPPKTFQTVCRIWASPSSV